LDEKTPHEVWTSKKPSLKHLRVFDYDDYVHIPMEKMSKIDKKVETCFIIGYIYLLKGYNLWNPENKKVVYSRDVVFREIKDVVQ
jgi:hypothetical protein